MEEKEGGEGRWVGGSLLRSIWMPPSWKGEERGWFRGLVGTKGKNASPTSGWFHVMTTIHGLRNLSLANQLLVLDKNWCVVIWSPQLRHPHCFQIVWSICDLPVRGVLCVSLNQALNFTDLKSAHSGHNDYSNRVKGKILISMSRILTNLYWGTTSGWIFTLPQVPNISTLWQVKSMASKAGSAITTNCFMLGENKPYTAPAHLPPDLVCMCLFAPLAWLQFAIIH